MSLTPILEKQVRSISSAALYVNASGEWEIGALGTTMQNLIPVQFSGQGVNDQTFEMEAVRAEKTSTGYALTLRSQANPSEIYTLTVSDAGQLDVQSVNQLSLLDVLSLESSLGTDLNQSSSLGDGSAVLDDGLLDVLIEADGTLSILNTAGEAVVLSYGDEPLFYQDLQDNGLDILEVLPDELGFLVYVSDVELGDVYLLATDVSGVIESFDLIWLWDEELQDYIDVTDTESAYDADVAQDQSSELELEDQYGVDIQGDQDKALEQGWTAELNNEYLRQTIDAATTSDGTLDYSETIGLFQGLIQELTSAGQTLITEELMTDLKAVSARGKSLFSSTAYDGQDNEYLSNVMGCIVNGSAANGIFTGGQSKAIALNNLSAGATVDNLSLLVDKWLLGKDLPTPAVGGDSANPNAYSVLGSYKTFSGVLFADVPTVTDIRQGPFGDCYLLACLQAVADSQPQVLQAMFVPNPTVNGHRTWGVRFYDFAGKETWVTVNDQLPVTSSSAPASSEHLIIGSSSNPDEIWVPLFEKAYAQVNETGILRRELSANSFIAIEGGLFDPIVSILGSGKLSSIQNENIGWGSSPIYSVTTTANNRQQLIDAVAKDINSGKPVGLASFVNTTTSSGETLYTAPHAYYLDDADPSSSTNLTVKVYNPWGVSLGLAAGNEHVSPFEANLSDLINTWNDGTHFYLQVYDYTGPGALVSGSADVSNVAASATLQSKLETQVASTYNKLLTAGDDLCVGDDAANLLNGGFGNDRLSGLAGNDTLDGGAGIDSAYFDRAASTYKLSVKQGSTQLQDLSGADGLDTLTRIELLEFSDRQVQLESREPSVAYADLPDELYQFFITAFGAAPGVTYMDQLAQAYIWFNGKVSNPIKTIVDIFTTKSQFTDVYPTSLSAEALATQLVERIVKTSATENAKIAAITDVKEALSSGWSTADVIYTVFGNLAGKSFADTSWGGTAKQFATQVVVAKYYTDTLNQSTSDLETLRDVMEVVTAATDVSSDTALADLIGVSLLNGGAL